MVYLLKKKNNDLYYYRPRKTKFVDIEDFFCLTDRPDSNSYFQTIEEIELHMESRIIHLKLTANKPILKRLIEEARNFEIIELTASSTKKLRSNFSKALKELMLFQAINARYGFSVADFYFEMKRNKKLVKYIINTYFIEKERIVELLGGDLIFYNNYIDYNTVYNPKKANRRASLFIGTNDKEDINLLKICFENKDIFLIETKKLNSLS